MSTVFRKLNLKDGTDVVVVLDAPASFEPELAALEARGVRVARRADDVASLTFALAFVTTAAGRDAAAEALAARVEGDAVLWFAYPKQSSTRYRSELRRDAGWDALGRAGFEGVRQVAIDADWTALRFRRVEFVRALARDPARALTAAGKARADASRRR